jgi:hypothetical protein
MENLIPEMTFTFTETNFEEEIYNARANLMLQRSSLLEIKPIPAFTAFCSVATHGQWVARANKSSTIGYGESETAFRKPPNVFGVLAPSYSFVIYRKAEKILKRFLMLLNFTTNTKVKLQSFISTLTLRSWSRFIQL